MRAGYARARLMTVLFAAVIGTSAWSQGITKQGQPDTVPLALRDGLIHLTVPGPVQAGAVVTATLGNGMQQPLSYVLHCEVRILRTTGELVSTPFYGGLACDQVLELGPGQITTFDFPAPQEAGTYVVLFPYGPRAAAKLEVGTPSAGALDLAFYPSQVEFPSIAHAVDFDDPAQTTWELANVGAADHAFQSGDRIELFTPGGTTPVAELDLSSLSVASGQVLQVALPVPGLAPGPYSVGATYADPGAGAVVTVGSGIQPRVEPHADLHVDRHVLSPGGVVDMSVVATGFPFESQSTDPLYLVLVGMDPGQTPFGDAIVPLAASDPLVAASIGGLGGLLTNHTGTISLFGGAAEGITLAHSASFAGTTLRVAALAINEDAVAASQPENIAVEI